MPNASPTSIRITRRTLLKAGIAGGAALLLARWLYIATSEPSRTTARKNAVAHDETQILSAIIPVLLGEALPGGADHAAAQTEALSGALEAIAGLPSVTRKELDQLFALLAFAPTRCLVAGVWSPWPEASAESIAAFLVSWRDSRFALQRFVSGAQQRETTVAPAHEERCNRLG